MSEAFINLRLFSSETLLVMVQDMRSVCRDPENPTEGRKEAGMIWIALEMELANREVIQNQISNLSKT